jgi:predicted dithiol-disulfide oxidoreductase (DUF899 family)
MSSQSPIAIPMPRIVDRDQWLAARKALLEKEKEATRARDALAAQRRNLPMVKLDAGNPYLFDAPQGKVTLADLFGPHSQLVIYHFMFGPNWGEGCPSCSYVADHLNAALPHLAARDTSLVMVSSASLPKIADFKKRMGWQFPWVSSHANTFNRDFHVTFSPEDHAKGPVDYNYKLQSFPSTEAPGLSVFYKHPETSDLFHTYSTYSRGLDALLTTYTVLDLTPKGRDEDQLPFTMQWLRHHDRYQGGAFADPDKPYWPKVADSAPEKVSSCCGSSKAK